jgi:hypothetical protein
MYQGGFIVEAINRGIIAGLEPDKQIRIVVPRQFVKQFSQPYRTDFGCSTTGFRQTRQRFFT